MKQILLGFASLLFVPGFAQAQDDEARAEPEEATRPNMPNGGLAAAATYQLSWFGDEFAHGPGADFRIAVGAGDTYPFFVVIAGFSYNHLFLEGEGEADAYSPYVMVGAMIPLDLFMETPSDLPRAAGIPVYASLKPADVLNMNGETLVGWGVRVGVQMPIPPIFGFNIEYDYASYGDEGNTLGFGERFARHSLNFGLQITAAPF